MSLSIKNRNKIYHMSERSLHQRHHDIHLLQSYVTCSVEQSDITCLTRLPSDVPAIIPGSDYVSTREKMGTMLHTVGGLQIHCHTVLPHPPDTPPIKAYYTNFSAAFMNISLFCCMTVRLDSSSFVSWDRRGDVLMPGTRGCGTKSSSSRNL